MVGKPIEDVLSHNFVRGLTSKRWEDQVSISSTFYVHLFCTIANRAAFSSFSFVIFGANILYVKRTHKTLMKLTAKNYVIPTLKISSTYFMNCVSWC